MSSYATLQAQIATELHRSDLTTDIQTAILSAIRHYSRKLMLFSQGTHSPVIVAGTAEYSLPSDFLAFERVEITIDGDTTLLDEVSSNEMAALDDDSLPKANMNLFSEPSTTVFPQWASVLCAGNVPLALVAPVRVGT